MSRQDSLYYVSLTLSYSVALVFMEAIARLFGRRDTVCCGKEDVFEAFSSATCIYTLVYG